MPVFGEPRQVKKSVFMPYAGENSLQSSLFCSFWEIILVMKAVNAVRSEAWLCEEGKQVRFVSL